MFISPSLIWQRLGQHMIKIDYFNHWWIQISSGRQCSDVTCWCILATLSTNTVQHLSPSTFSLLRRKPDDSQSTWVAQLPADRTSLPLTSSREHNYKIQFREFFNALGGTLVAWLSRPDLLWTWCTPLRSKAERSGFSRTACSFYEDFTRFSVCFFIFLYGTF